MTDFKKIFALASAALLALTAAAAPVSKEYVDNRVTELRSDITNVSNKLDEAVSDLESKIAIGSTSQHYIYDDQSKPSTNLLDAAGQLFKLSLEEGKERGGYWTIDKAESQATTTYIAHFDGYQNSIYTWKTNGIFRVDYDINTGIADVQLLFEPMTNGTYSCGAGNDPLDNKIPDDGFQHVTGYKVDSLHYISQGPSVKASQPYDSFVKTSKHNTDMQGVVKSVNGQSGPNVTLTIPSVAGLASETYVNSHDVDLVTKTDAYKISSSEPTAASVVGRLKTLEHSQQEIKHDVVYELWNYSQTQVIDGEGKTYGTHQENLGAWLRYSSSSSFVLTNGIYDAEQQLYIWHDTGNTLMTYCPTNGNLVYGSGLLAILETDLDPMVDDLGVVDGGSVAQGNKFEFIVPGKVRNNAVTDNFVKQSLINNGSSSIAVTRIRVDNEKDVYGNAVYRRGSIELPNYTGSINGLKADIKTTNMDTAWPDSDPSSIVGRIKTLEGGGANKAFLNRTDMDSELVDSISKTNNSIVGNLYRVKNDYVKHSNATNIAGHVATNVVDDKVTEAYIKGKNFYNKAEIDDLLDSRIEQKRVDYIYDSVDNPKQVMDSDGKLFWFGIDDLGGSFNATNTTEGSQYLGSYIYKGFLGGTNRWTNAYAKVIWYEPETGKMGDTINGAYEGSIDPGLFPTNCDKIADINTDKLKAKFIPQATNVNHVYRSSYDRLAKKSELDQIRADDLERVTNSIPQMYAASTAPAARRFNPLFTAIGSWDLEGPTSPVLSNGRAIRIPIDTMHNRKVEIGFKAQIPSTDYRKSYVFLKSSSASTVPSLIYSNNYVYAEYPQRTSLDLYNLPTDKFLGFTLTIDKQQGKAVFAVTNSFSGAYWTKTFPSGSSMNTSKAYNDTVDICYSDVVGMAESAYFYLDLESVYVRYIGADNEWLDKAWLFRKDSLMFSDSWQQTYKLFAERDVAPSGFVELRAATTNQYGLVKPDGTTIRINAETGKLEADAGGVDLQQVIDLVAKTNTDVIAGIDVNSTAGRAIDAQSRISGLETQVQELISTISNLNTRIEAALNGN